MPMELPIIFPSAFWKFMRSLYDRGINAEVEGGLSAEEGSPDTVLAPPGVLQRCYLRTLSS